MPHPTLNVIAIAFLVWTLQSNATGLAGEPVDADLLLSDGILHLGDGEPPQVGDIAVIDGKIAAVGQFEAGRVERRVDCSGLIICPGFIDIHSHSDRPATRRETRLAANFLTQGCTTFITGNCGSGPIDVKAYYEKLDEYGVGLNIAHLLPQGELRRVVLGSERRSATETELQKMKSLAAKAMKDGAWGFSTGLIYVPSSYADTAELIEIAKVVSDHGGIYASHIRDEGVGLLDAVSETIKIGRQANIPIHISHLKSKGKDAWGLVRVAIEEIKKHREAGVRITADQYPYVASSTSLQATLLPTWARAGGSNKMLERLRTGPNVERLRKAIRKNLEITDNGGRIQIARYRPDPSWAGRRLNEIAQDQQVEPLEMVLQMLERDSDTKIVNYGINEQDVRYVMKQPWVATASDGSAKIPSSEVPHPRNYGTFPRKIGHYAVREKVISVSQAIRSATGLPADILGLSDRGYLRVGQAADIAVWNENELIDKATFDAPDRYSVGIEYLFVNGIPAIDHGHITGALAGQPLRHPLSRQD